MSIEELLFKIAMEDGSPEAYQIIKTIPKEHWNEVVSLWEDGLGNDLPNTNSLTRLQYIADGINNDNEDNLPSDPNAEDNDWRTDQMKALSGEDWEDDAKDTGMSEQERELRAAILSGMKEGPDERW